MSDPARTTAMSLVNDWTLSCVSDVAKKRALDAFLRTPSARGMGYTFDLTPGGWHANVRATRKVRDADGNVKKTEAVEFQVHAYFAKQAQRDEIFIRAREKFCGKKRPPVLRNLRAEIMDEEDRIGLSPGSLEKQEKVRRKLYK